MAFWETIDFWIFLILSVASLIASIKSFYEAKAAKVSAEAAKLAAIAAAQTVKIQTITIELSEIIQKLDRLEPNIEFSQARDFYSEINRRIRRLTAPFKDEGDYKDTISLIHDTLETIPESLATVRPLNQESEIVIENTVYYAVEKHFSDLGGQLAELMGLFEKRTINTN